MKYARLRSMNRLGELPQCCPSVPAVYSRHRTTMNPKSASAIKESPNFPILMVKQNWLPSRSIQTSE
jgi:hypothetical protein